MVETVSLELDGVKITVISTGAAIARVEVPDRKGVLDDIVLGHPSFEDYKARFTR
jgi:galactose mutarotase-like enzyme